jgi:uncharacterized protein YqgV (UPF0045/DUF77 family)
VSDPIDSTKWTYRQLRAGEQHASSSANGSQLLEELARRELGTMPKPGDSVQVHHNGAGVEGGTVDREGHYPGMLDVLNGHATVEILTPATQEHPKRRLFIDHIRAFAEANYETNGWDYVVEAYEDDELWDLVKDCRTRAHALAAVRRVVKTKHDYREDIQNA